MNGFDGVIYAVSFLVGWPVILFFMAEKLRNLGKFTFADIAAYRLAQKEILFVCRIKDLMLKDFF